jgi:hypothetical protein
VALSEPVQEHVRMVRTMVNEAAEGSGEVMQESAETIAPPVEPDPEPHMPGPDPDPAPEPSPEEPGPAAA